MAFGADRTVKVNLKANVSDYIGKVTAAGKATRDFSRDAVKSAEAHRQSWDKVGKGMLIAGGLLAAGVGLAVKSYADFDQKLSTVRAVSGATASEMEKLSAAALKAGADTKYSASQAAEAEGELAKLGVSTADILGGALRGSLDLAAAGNLNLADAATYAGQSMKIFNLAGKDVPHIADVLAAGANKSAADVQTLAQALQQGGLVAAQTGLTLEDTVGVLSAFSDNALNGSDAGTSFKTMLQRLNPQSEQAANLMDQLGLRAYDASGQFIGITAYAGKLQKALGGMTAEQRNATMQTIFGSDAVRAANVLYKEGAAGIGKYVSEVNDQGAASRVAAIQMDNLNGDIEQLRGSIETSLIQAGSAGNDVLRDMVQHVTSAVNAFSSLPKPVQQGALVVAAIASAALLAGGAFLTVVPRIAATKTALKDLGVTSDRASGALKKLGKAAAIGGAFVALGNAVGMFTGKAEKATAGVETVTSALLDLQKTNSIDALDKIFQGTSNMGYDDVNGFADAIDRLANPGINDRLNNLAGNLVTVGGALGNPDAISGKKALTDQLEQLGQALAGLEASGQSAKAGELFDRLTAASKASGMSVAQLLDYMPAYKEALAASANEAANAAPPTDTLAGIVNGVAVSAEDAGKAIDDYVKALADAGLVQLSARDAARNFQQALDDVDASIKKNGRSLDITTQKGRDNQKALDDVAGAAIDQAQALYESTKATDGESAAQEAYRGSLLKSRESLIKVAEKFGLSKAAAKKFADQLLQIPAKVEPQVGIRGAEAATIKAKNLRDALLGIKSRTVTVDVITRTANKIAANPRMQASGGYITGPGSATSDSIPAYLSNGEYVVKAAAVDKYGSAFFDRLNSMRFASGGLVTRAAASAAPATANGPVTFNAYGNDSETAMRKALRQWEFAQVPRS